MPSSAKSTPTFKRLVVSYLSRADRVAVVVPCYNEESSIRTVIESMPDFVWKIIVVDDASTDTSAQILQGLATSRILFFRQEKNQGVGAAIIRGYRHALELDARIVAVMAGDGQMDPSELERIVLPIQRREADYVKGNRFLSGLAHRLMPTPRILGSLALSAWTRQITGYRHISDSQCGFTAISAECLSHLPLHELYPRYGYPNDLLSRLSLSGARVTERSVTPIYPSRHSHMNLPRVAPRLAFLMLRLSWRHGRKALLHRLSTLGRKPSDPIP